MNITTSNLGWAILACLLAGVILSAVQEWACDRFEFSFSRRRIRARRRWYGAAAHVCLRSDEDDDDPDRFAVLTWWDENTAVPWLLAHRLDREHITGWDEDAEAFWAPVTDFAPYTVRRFRPHFFRFGRVRVPWLTKWLPLRDPAGFLDGSGPHLGEGLPPFGFPGDKLELAPPGRVPLVPGEPVAEMPLEDAGEAVPGGVGDDLDGVFAAPVAEYLEVECARPAGHGSQGNPRTGG